MNEVPGKRPRHPIGFGAVLLALAAMLAGSLPAFAVPVFARKYKTSCQTCHVGFPKLNAFGEAFRLNGYRFPNETEAQVKVPQTSLGSDAYKRMWPKMIYPSDIPGNVPLAMNIKMASIYLSSVDDTGRTVVKNDFQFPQEVNLFSAGTMGDHMSFFGEMTWAQDAGETGTEIEHAELHFNSPFGPEHMVNFKIGKFAPDLADGFQEMWISTDNAIDTLFSYNPIGVAGGTGLSEDMGGISLPMMVEGIEMYGVAHHRFFYTAGITNGLGPGDGTADGNASKDFYARADYKFGGMGLDGDTTGVNLPPQNWRERSLRVGILGYQGNGKGIDFPVDSGMGMMADEMPANLQDRTFSRAGLYASWWFDDLNVFGVAMNGRDTIDAFADDGSLLSRNEPTYDTWFVQADYVITPVFQTSLRYESLKPGDRSVDSLRFLNASFSYFAYANVKGMLEYRRDLNESKNYQLSTVLRYAF
ncbi:MAG: hypothetical protein WBX15_00855 [Thermoanaerobaculia bacterium]